MNYESNKEYKFLYVTNKYVEREKKIYPKGKQEGDQVIHYTY